MRPSTQPLLDYCTPQIDYYTSGSKPLLSYYTPLLSYCTSSSHPLLLSKEPAARPNQPQHPLPLFPICTPSPTQRQASTNSPPLSPFRTPFPHITLTPPPPTPGAVAGAAGAGVEATATWRRPTEFLGEKEVRRQSRVQRAMDTSFSHVAPALSRITPALAHYIIRSYHTSSYTHPRSHPASTSPFTPPVHTRSWGRRMCAVAVTSTFTPAPPAFAPAIHIRTPALHTQITLTFAPQVASVFVDVLLHSHLACTPISTPRMHSSILIRFHTRTHTVHIYAHLAYSNFAYSHLACSNLAYSHFACSHLAYSHLAYSHLAYSHLPRRSRSSSWMASRRRTSCKDRSVIVGLCAPSPPSPSSPTSSTPSSSKNGPTSQARYLVPAQKIEQAAVPPSSQGISPCTLFTKEPSQSRTPRPRPLRGRVGHRAILTNPHHSITIQPRNLSLSTLLGSLHGAVTAEEWATEPGAIR